MAAGQALASARYNTQTATTNMGNFIASWFGGGGTTANPAATPQVTPQVTPQPIQTQYTPGPYSQYQQAPIDSGLNLPQWGSGNFSGIDDTPYPPTAE